MPPPKQKHKDAGSSSTRKRRHKSPNYPDDQGPPKEKRHRHRRHHKDKKQKEKSTRGYESDGSDVVEIISDREDHPSGSGESLSVEETNKLRAKLGLKPLETSSSDNRKKDDGKKKDDLGEFYHKPAENWAHKAEREKIKNKIAQQKEKRKLEHKLGSVQLLAESDDDDNASSWIDKTRQIELAKKEAEKRAKALEEMDEQFGVSDFLESEAREKRKRQYSSKHLRGLRVDHDMDSFAEERDVVLTLKDKGVLDEDGEDVLVNVNMVDDERYKKSMEARKKKQVYNAYEDQEFDEFGNPQEKSLLAQYDETIDGEKRDSFKIGHDNLLERKMAATKSIKEKLKQKTLESIEDRELKLASEYYNDEEMAKFKKPRKKLRKIRQKGKLTADELENLNNRGIESVGSRRPKTDDYSIDDIPTSDIQPTNMKLDDDKDDILERALHKTRKIKQKENLVAEIIKSEPVKEEDDEDGGHIVLNSTAEFCRTLGDIPTYGKSGNRDETEDLIDYGGDVKDDEDDDQNPMEADGWEQDEKTGWNSVDPNLKPTAEQRPRIDPQEVQILDEEPDVSQGMGAALKLAMSKGYLDKEVSKRPSNSNLAHLQAKHYSIEDKTYGDDGERGGRRERYAGPITDFKEKEFKPNVKLEYIDDDGHLLNSKEAFRYLSHKFHGKGPGKNKIEKRIKKGVQEQLMKKMNSNDTPLGTLNMLKQKQKETHSAFVVLSGKSQATVISKSRR